LKGNNIVRRIKDGERPADYTGMVIGVAIAVLIIGLLKNIIF